MQPAGKTCESPIRLVLSEVASVGSVKWVLSLVFLFYIALYFLLLLLLLFGPKLVLKVIVGSESFFHRVAIHKFYWSV